MRRLAFTVPGIPVAKGRPRFRIGPDGKPWTYTPAKTRKYECDVAMVAQQAAMAAGWTTATGPVRLSLLFYLREIKRPAFELPAVRPDWDNLAKAVQDAMTAAGIWDDDGRVCWATVVKLYGDPRVEVEVTAI